MILDRQIPVDVAKRSTGHTSRYDGTAAAVERRDRPDPCEWGRAFDIEYIDEQGGTAWAERRG